MVDRQSATGSRILDPSFTVQIDEDHSDMVKFNLGDFRTSIIITKIQEMCSLGEKPRGMDPAVTATSVDSDIRCISDASHREQALLDDARRFEVIGVDKDCENTRRTANTKICKALTD